MKTQLFDRILRLYAGEYTNEFRLTKGGSEDHVDDFPSDVIPDFYYLVHKSLSCLQIRYDEGHIIAITIEVDKDHLPRFLTLAEVSINDADGVSVVQEAVRNYIQLKNLSPTNEKLIRTFRTIVKQTTKRAKKLLGI